MAASPSLPRAHFAFIDVRCGDLPVCVVATLPPAQGQEIGARRGAECAFSPNNPFNLSSIMRNAARSPDPITVRGQQLQADKQEKVLAVRGSRDGSWVRFDGKILKPKIESKQTIRSYVSPAVNMRILRERQKKKKVSKKPTLALDLLLEPSCS